MADIARVYYVLAESQASAILLGEAIHRGLVPPMAKDRAELTRLRLLHPLPMIGRYNPYAVFTGLAKTVTSRLDSGDWATEIARAFEAHRHTQR